MTEVHVAGQCSKHRVERFDSSPPDVVIRTSENELDQYFLARNEVYSSRLHRSHGFVNVQ